MKNKNTPQKLEDIATAYWYGDVLFTAVAKDIFGFLTTAATAAAAGQRLGFPADATDRFLKVLVQMELLEEAEGRFQTTAYAKKYLIKESPAYQGHAILWRKTLASQWDDLTAILGHGGRYRFGSDAESAVNDRFRQYSLAMDDTARCKAQEILFLLKENAVSGNVLDLGCGLGSLSLAFLKAYPRTTATLIDMEQVLTLAKERFPAELTPRLRCCPGDILAPWDFPPASFEVALLSNITHAFDGDDNESLLAKTALILKDNGFFLIHDFFPEHCPAKAAAMNLNMLINTYNGRIYTAEEIKAILKKYGFKATAFLPLASDTAVLIAARNQEWIKDVVKEGLF